MIVSDWYRLRSWSVDGRMLELAAVVETTRDGFLVSIRHMKNGYVKDILASKRLVATGIGRTADSAFKKAMDLADKILLGAKS